MKRISLAAITALLTVLATASVAGACWWSLYQPRVPKSLEK